MAHDVAASRQPSKTVGPRTAQLLTTLYERGRTTFSLRDVESATGLRPASARSLVRAAAARGLVSRVKPGLFVIVPPELGRASEYYGDPLLIARDLVGGAEYYLSHGTAMELHRMVTQPQLVVFVSSTKRLRSRILHGTEFRFVLRQPGQLFGLMRHWVSKQDAVCISDPERTVIDGLREPTYCGGVSEVAKGMWMKRGEIRVNKLLDYALRIRSGAVIRRLGYLLEFYGLASGSALERLRRSLSATYVLLDPTLPNEGSYLSRWKLRLNISPDELDALRRS